MEAEAREVALGIGNATEEIQQLEEERKDAEGLLGIAETNLEKAEGELGRFKNRYDID